MIAAVRENKDALIAELQAAGGIVKGNVVKCPFHDDNSPSGGFYQGEDGAWRYKCQAESCGFCGDLFDVRARVNGTPVADVLKQQRGSNQKPAKIYPTLDDIKRSISGELESVYEYLNPSTNEPDLIIFRCRNNGGKRFIQASPTAGGYVTKAPPKPWPLYKRREIAQSEIVIVVEGEKCADVLGRFGFTATTSPGGAGKAAYTDYSPLAGKKLYLWPDNDSVGVNHLREVRQICEKLEPRPRLFWIDPQTLDLPPKGDVVDLAREAYAIDKNNVRSEIEQALSKAKPCSVASEVGDWIEDVVTGKQTAIEWPWPALTRLTQALIPQTVTIICGDPGATKTFMLLQALCYWQEQGIKVATYVLEDDRRSHLQRVLAQRAGNSNLTDLSWLKENAEEAKTAYQGHRGFLDAVGRHIDQAPMQQRTLEDLAQWVLEKAKAGYRVICIDPVTAATATAQPWVSDSKFIASVKASVREYGASLVLVTHPKKGRSGFGLDELAGGAIYQRLAQTVLWVEYHNENQSAKVKTDCGSCEAEFNRTVHLCKVRNARGQGLRLGYVFHNDSLLLSEQGIIISDKQRGKSK